MYLPNEDEAFNLNSFLRMSQSCIAVCKRRCLLNLSHLKCCAYSRAALIWRLDAANNCFNYVTIIFRIKGAELTSFDFDHIWAAVLIRRRRLWTFFFSRCGAYSILALFRRRRYTVQVKLVLRGFRCGKEAKREKNSALTLILDDL